MTPGRRRVDVNIEDLDRVLDGAREVPLSEADCEKVKTALHAMAAMLVRPRNTEKTNAVLPKSEDPGKDAGPRPDESSKPPAKGHGRNGADAFSSAQKVDIKHQNLKHGDRCPDCGQGNVYGQKKADYRREDGIAGYAWIARYARAFLDAYLKGLAGPKEFLRNGPSQNGVPAHFMTAMFRAAVVPPASIERFRAEAAQLSFGDLSEVYEQWRIRHQFFELPESVLQGWSEELLDANHVSEALEVLKLTVQLHPRSSAAYERLSDAYQSTGQRELAVETCKLALEEDADNADARMRLQELLSIEARPA